MLTRDSAQAVVSFVDSTPPDPVEVLRLHSHTMTLPQKAACEAVLQELLCLRRDVATRNIGPQDTKQGEALAECARCTKLAELFTHEAQQVSRQHAERLRNAYTQFGIVLDNVCGK